MSRIIGKEPGKGGNELVETADIDIYRIGVGTVVLNIRGATNLLSTQ